jgi:hypothetical protein
MERNLTEYETIFANHLLVKGIYKEFSYSILKEKESN